jgi:hypothetical protein
MRFGSVSPGGPGDVEMGPFGLIDELLDKHGTHNGTGLSAGSNILDISDV